MAGCGLIWVCFGFGAYGLSFGCNNQSGDEARGFVASVQYHLLKTSDQHYNLRPAKTIALRSKEVVRVVYNGEVRYPTPQEIAEVDRGSLIEEWKRKFCRTRARMGGGRAPDCRENPVDSTLKTKNKFLFFHKELKWGADETFLEQAHEPQEMPLGEGIVDIFKRRAPIGRPGAPRVQHEVLYSIQALENGQMIAGARVDLPDPEPLGAPAGKEEEAEDGGGEDGAADGGQDSADNGGDESEESEEEEVAEDLAEDVAVNSDHSSDFQQLGEVTPIPFEGVGFIHG